MSGPSLNDRNPFNFDREWTKGIDVLGILKYLLLLIFKLERLIKNMFWLEYFLVILLSIASLVLKIRLYILYKMFILILFNLIKHSNKREILPINNQKKVRLFFW